MQANQQILKSILSLGLNYLRWTQLTPMLMVWGFALAMVLALTLINFPDQIFSGFGAVLQWLSGLPVVGEYVTRMMSENSGETHTTTGDYKSLLLKAWSIVSLAFMLASMALAALFGPFQPWTLKRKLLYAGLGTLLLLAGLAANVLANPSNFNGGLGGWMLNFSLIALLVFLVSAYCLSVSHFLRFLDDALMKDAVIESAGGISPDFSPRRTTK